MYWVKYHLEHLKNWRRAAEAILKAVKDLSSEAEAHVVGGAAEDRLTALSDVDVLICVGPSSSRRELAQLRKRILSKAIDEYGLPWDYPVELHIYGKGECEEFLKGRGKTQLRG